MEAPKENPIFNRMVQHYDQSIVNNPDWLSVKQIETMLGLGDRSVRNKAQSNNWQKRYAKVDGSPMVFFAKTDVDKYLKENNLLKADPIADAELADHQGTSAQDSTLTPEEARGDAAESAPEHAANPLKVVNSSKEMAFQIEKALSVHKDALTRITTLEEKRLVAETSLTKWKINFAWVAGVGAIALVGVAILGYSLTQILKSSQELSRNNSELSNKYTETQEKLFSTKATLLEKEALILQYQNESANKPQ
jgi:hypothetical protein